MTREEWLAIKNHDPAYDGKIFYTVKHSNSVCRPSCTAKNCRPEQVILFDSLEDAVSAGYHPCNRCRPDLPEWKGARQEVAHRAKSYIESHYLDKFSLHDMAASLFLNKIYLSKCFKDITGDTLLHYHNYVRCRHACELLTHAELSIDIISNRVGYATPSHFARTFRGFYDCSPTEYRKRYLKSLNKKATLIP